MGLPKICYYKRIVTIYDVTISGLKCITEIGKLQGPSIYCYYMRIVTISGVTIYGLHCIADVRLSLSVVMTSPFIDCISDMYFIHFRHVLVACFLVFSEMSLKTIRAHIFRAELIFAH